MRVPRRPDPQHIVTLSGHQHVIDLQQMFDEADKMPPGEWLERRLPGGYSVSVRRGGEYHPRADRRDRRRAY